MKNFLKKMFSAGDEVSSKRVIATFTWLLMAIIAMVNLFTGRTVSQFIWDGLMYIVIANFAANALEVFGRNKSSTVNVASVENVTVESAQTTTSTTTAAIQSFADFKPEDALAENEVIG